MRTIPIPPVALSLLLPLLALAQPGQEPSENRQAATSPLTWYWVGVVAIAVVAFVVSNIIVARRKGGPGGSSRPRVS